MSGTPFIVAPRDLRDVYEHVDRVVDRTAGLPNSPFRENGRDSLCEFEQFRAGTFGPTLAALVSQFGDECVSGLSTDPDADYFDQFYRTSGAFNIPAAKIAEDYWTVLSHQPDDDVTGALFFAADVLCVVGSSGAWAIWGERALGVAIVRSKGSDMSWREGSSYFASAEEALWSFVEPNFNRGPMPANFAEDFLRNFDSNDV